MGQIFISYRRKDSAGHSGRLHDRLCYWFEKGRLFFDRESIKGGEVFSAVIEEAVRSSEVLLAVIGPDWLDDEHRPRLHQEGDLVRREIALALELAKGDEHRRVIPLLCGGASMPSKDDLPEDLLSLCELNAIELSEADYDFSFEKLLDTIRSPKLKPVFQTAHHTRPSNLPVKKLTPYFADPLNMLSALRKALEDDGSALVSTAIHGMGGVGKTQLALKYGATFCDDYAGVWWFSSEDPLLLEQGCAELCKEMHIQRAEKEPASSAAKDWLRKTPGRWLLIYDNVEEPSMIKELIPEKGEHHIIYTSRTPHWGSLVAKNAQVEIKSWSAEQAQEFLSLRLPEATREQNLSLAEALGGLPLALEQACAYIDRIRISIETYCERVMELLDKADPTSNYHASVEATLALAFDKLSPAAKELLALASYCAPEPIPDLLFRASAIVSNDEEREGLLPPALLTAASDELLWGETRAELTGFALAQLVDIDLTPAGSDDKHIENALVLHRLTQAAAIKRLEQGDSSLEMLIALLYRAYPQDMNSHRNWPLAAALAPHVKHYQETFETTTIAFKALSWLFDRYATYLQYGQALYDEAIDLFKMLLERDKVVHGKDHPSTLTSMNNLALTLKAMGDHAGARVLHEQELQKCKEILGEDHPSTLTSMNNLASTLWQMGDHAGAKALQEQVLQKRKEIQGEDHPSTLTSMNNLALTLRAMGDHAGAKALEEEVLQKRKEIQGEDHPSTLTSMNNLAHTLGAMGDHVGAKALEEEVLQKRKEILGEDHPDTLTSMNNLASTLVAMGDHAGAKALQEQVLQKRKEILGEDHPETTGSAWNLFTTLHEMNDHTAAKAVLDEHLLWLLDENVELTSGAQRKIRDMLRQAVGGGGEEEGVSASDVMQQAVALMEQEQWQEAKELLQPLLAAMNEQLEISDPKLTIVAWHKFLCLHYLEERERAQEILNEHLLWLTATPEADIPNELKELRKQVTQITGGESGEQKADGAEEKGVSASDVMQQAVALMEQGQWLEAKGLLQPLLAEMNAQLEISDPNLTIVAWHKFLCLHNLEESERAQQIVDKHLLWLAQLDEQETPEELKPLREPVTQAVGDYMDAATD